MSEHELTPEEAYDLMEDEDYAYVDVRTEDEFAGGHPEGAYNVPINLRGPGGMARNPDFVTIMEANFPKDAKLIVGCQMGGRSRAAVAMLREAGFTDVRDQIAGFGGKKDSFGGMAEPGWQAAGLPIAVEAEDGRDYAALAAKKSD